MNPSVVFRLVKSKVSKLTRKEQDHSAPRASNPPDDVVSSGSASHRRGSLPISFQRRNRSPNRVSIEAQTSTTTHPLHSGLRPPVSNETPMRRNNALPTQESLIDTLYGAHGASLANDPRFPQHAVESHRRRRRRIYDISPAPPYSLVDPRPELSVALRDNETMRTRRPEPLIRL